MERGILRRLEKWSVSSWKFAEGELDEKVVVAEFATTSQHVAMEGRTQSNITKFYNLDVIISVGYWVKSQRGVQFRIWETNILKEYIKKALQWMMAA